MAQSGYGKILLFNDFTGSEVYATHNMEHASATGALWNIGEGFTIKGQNLDQTDAGATTVTDGLNGQILLTSSATAGGDAMFVTTEVCWKPSVNAPMALEVRCEMAALTLRKVFIGFVDAMIDAQTTILTGTTSTLAFTETDLVGFCFDSGLTEDNEWHMVHSGGTTTAVTDALLLNSGVTPVLAEMNVLRVEVDNNGTARWYIDGELLKTLDGAVSTSVIFAAAAGVETHTSTTAASVTLDYIAVEANRDWTI